MVRSVRDPGRLGDGLRAPRRRCRRHGGRAVRRDGGRQSSVGAWQRCTTGESCATPRTARAWLVWTYESELLLARASRADGDRAALYEWWRATAPLPASEGGAPTALIGPSTRSLLASASPPASRAATTTSGTTSTAGRRSKSSHRSEPRCMLEPTRTASVDSRQGSVGVADTGERAHARRTSPMLARAPHPFPGCNNPRHCWYPGSQG